MALHLLGIPHTVTRSDFSHCAFTGKVQRFAPMLRPLGVKVIHYGVEGSESGADEEVAVMSQEEHVDLLGHPYHEQPKGFYGDDATEDTPLYRQWNYSARQELLSRLQPGDVIACPFGLAHAAAVSDLPLVKARKVGVFESGIGYPDCFLPLRVYESFAWQHTVMAREARTGLSHDTNRLEWVIPNYYDVADWDFGAAGGGSIVFLGRIGKHKGVDIIPRLAAERDDITFILAGQGDPAGFLGLPNVRYLPPISGRARSQYLREARAIIAPSRYIEPFCGVVVEAALCGTPAITSSFGAFTETVEQGVTGFRCQTLNEWLDALDKVTDLDRAAVRNNAVRKYSLEAVGPQYNAVLTSITDSLLT